MKIYIINLTQRIDRREFQKQQFQKLALDYEFFDAIGVDDIDKKTHQKHYYDWQRPLKKSEVACYFSHKILWQTIVKNNQSALILEDDALLSKHTSQLLKELDNIINYDLINLEAFTTRQYLSKQNETLNTNPYKLYKHYLSGAACYIVYPTGAQKLLQCHNKKGISPADVHIHNCQSLNTYQIELALVVQMMLANHYQVKYGNAETIQSAISNTKKPKTNYRFKLKRIFGQIKLGFEQLCILHKSRKRCIALNSEDF